MIVQVPSWVPKVGLVRRAVQALLRWLMTESERIEYDAGHGPSLGDGGQGRPGGLGR